MTEEESFLNLVDDWLLMEEGELGLPDDTPVISPRMFELDDYRRLLPFYEGETWHPVVGSFDMAGSIVTMRQGTIEQGRPFTQNVLFWQWMRANSNVVYMQLGTHTHLEHSWIRVRHAEKDGQDFFFIRSTEVCMYYFGLKQFQAELFLGSYPFLKTGRIAFGFNAKPTLLCDSVENQLLFDNWYVKMQKQEEEKKEK